MKKISVFILAVLLLGILTSCGGAKYPPVESSELESTVVMTLKIEDEEYRVKYELYRALFLNVRDEIDGGDRSVWSGDKKDEYIALADAKIMSQIADIYSVIHVASEIGIDIYSSEFDDIVEEYIELSVDGDGRYDDSTVIGFGGDYDAYLEHLRKMNLNYSVQDLLLRYEIASNRIYDHHAGYTSTEFLEEYVEGALEFTKEDVKAFYKNNDECVRVIRAFLPSPPFTAQKAEEKRQRICEEEIYGVDAVVNYVIGLGVPTADSEVRNGDVIAKHNLDPAYYSELVEAAFALEYFDVSDVISITTGDSNSTGFNILYKINKTDEHFEECYESIKSVYVQNEIGKMIDSAADVLKASVQNTSFLNNLDRASISME